MKLVDNTPLRDTLLQLARADGTSPRPIAMESYGDTAFFKEQASDRVRMAITVKKIALGRAKLGLARVGKVLFFVLGILQFGNAPASAGDVAVLMSAEVDAYREALQGFKDVTSHKIIAEYNMAGDFNRGREYLERMASKDKPDLIFAIGIWALQLIAQQSTNIPVVYAMVLNPSTVIGDRPKNITGASINVSVSEVLEVFEALGPQIRRIGVAYNPDRTGYLVEQAREANVSDGIVLVTRQIKTAKEAINAIQELHEEQIDALWIVPDPALLDDKVIEFALLTSYRNNIPLLGLSERQAEMGAVVSIAYGSNVDIGRQAGELANLLLNSWKPESLPYTTARSTKIILNLRAAEKIGLNIPGRLMTMADAVIR